LHFLGASGWLDGWAKPQSSNQAIQAGLIIDNSVGTARTPVQTEQTSGKFTWAVNVARLIS
jgi:hypothetical protein